MCPWWWTAGIWSYRTALYLWLISTGVLTVGTSMYADLEMITYAGAAVGAAAGALAYSASCYLGRYQEQRLKSERLKTELITNVSHDIKTPLTSIVNYVDLLQREHTPEQEREYLAVLDRQAHKLKKLTVDLVEMSKASTGNIPCHIARRSVRELVDQTVGEYAEKLSAARLEPVVTLPDEELYCLCDGALMWRVLDNLLSNACKYACAGTRLYIAARREGDTVAFSFKNISRDALNIDPEELMERFVRGDSSRTTEGSGLGLNIAKSLVELQKGTFSIAIDGDLFKVGFVLPRTE